MSNEDQDRTPYLQVSVKTRKTDEKDLNRIKPDEIDEYGNYKLQWPQQNWNFVSRQDIPFIKPEFNELLIGSEMSLYNGLANWRHNFNLLWKATLGATLVTGFLKWRRHPHWTYGFFPLGTFAFGSLYSYSLGYGKMTNRVNVDAFHILNHGYKPYINSMGDISSVMKEMEAEEKKQQNQ